MIKILILLSLIVGRVLWLLRKVPVNLLYPIILLIIFAGALYLRIALPYHNVFTEDGIKFAATDPWYHVRLIANTAHHFPFRIVFDPLVLFPNGQHLTIAPFWDILPAFFAWVVGFGSPTEHAVEVVCAYAPAILGALTIIPVYLIGKEVFNRNVGLLAAAVVTILPGEFLGRSLLGHPDHHVAEVFFSTIAILFMILALKNARQKELSFQHFLSRDWKSIRKPLIYTVLVGVMLGMYLLTWTGGLVLVLILFSYLVLQYLIDHLRGKSTDYLGIIGVPSFLIPLAMIVPVSSSLLGSTFKTYDIVALVAGVLIFLVLSGASRLMSYRGINRFYYPLALAGLGIVALVGLRFIDHSLFSQMWGNLVGIFRPQGTEQTVQEARSIFLLGGTFSWSVTWYNFSTGFFIAFVALMLLVYAAIKEWSAEKTLLIVWSAIMIAATIGQVRFAYYLAINVAILTGYFSWGIVEIVRNVGFKKLAEGAKVRERVEDARNKQLSSARLTKKERKKQRSIEKRRREEKKHATGLEGILFSNRAVRYVLGAIIVFFLVFFPLGVLKGGTAWTDWVFGKAAAAARAPQGPNDDWYNSLVWMRDNTNTPEAYPEDFYYENYESPPDGEDYVYPESESPYGVISWWDYGYWITYIAHRIPDANPGYYPPPDRPNVAQFFMAQNESAATEILNALKAKYVIIDVEMATGKFYAMTRFAGGNESQYYDLYYEKVSPQGTQYQAVWYYYPEYYRSMCSRLYIFGGNETIPAETRVISYDNWTDPATGITYKMVTDSQTFTTNETENSYAQAEEFRQTHPDYRIVGTNQFDSPVPLEKLDHYQLVHNSNTPTVTRQITIDSQVSQEPVAWYVEIFEYTP